MLVVDFPSDVSSAIFTPVLKPTPTAHALNLVRLRPLSCAVNMGKKKKKGGKEKGDKAGGGDKLPPPPNLEDQRQGAREALLTFKLVLPFIDANYVDKFFCKIYTVIVLMKLRLVFYSIRSFCTASDAKILQVVQNLQVE